MAGWGLLGGLTRLHYSGKLTVVRHVSQRQRLTVVKLEDMDV